MTREVYKYCQVVDGPDGRIFGIRNINIDGEPFLLTIPTEAQWIKFTQYLKEHPELESVWSNFVGKQCSYVLCQMVFLDGRGPGCMRMKNSIADNETSPKYELLNPYKEYKTVCFIPALIPLKPNGEYDKLNPQENMEMFYGGTMYVDYIPASVDKKSLFDLIDCSCEDYKEFRIGDTHDGTPLEVLSWVQVGDAYLATRPLLSNVHFVNLVKKFGGEVSQSTFVY